MWNAHNTVLGSKRFGYLRDCVSGRVQQVVKVICHKAHRRRRRTVRRWFPELKWEINSVARTVSNRTEIVFLNATPLIWTSDEINRTRCSVNVIWQVTATCPSIRAHWRHLANTIELVHPSAHSIPQSKRQMNRFSRFCTVLWVAIPTLSQRAPSAFHF